MTEPSSGRESPMVFRIPDLQAFGGVRDGTGRVASPLLEPFAPHHYVLVLDGSDQRFAATTYTLATLALYVYGSPVDSAARTFWGRMGWDPASGRSRPVRRADIGSFKASLGEHLWVPTLVRAVPPADGYYVVRGISASGGAFPGWDAQAFAACCRDHLVIAFRGTETQGTIVDILDDAVALSEPVPFLQGVGSLYSGSYLPFDLDSAAPAAHQGFVLQYEKVAAQIEALLDESLRGPWGAASCPRVYVTGHSLGGALATLCAMHIRAWSLARGRDLAVSCTTFAQPRVSTESLARWAGHPDVRRRLQIFAIRNVDDVVPMVPSSGPGPQLLANPYLHVGQRYHCNVAHRPAIHRAHREWTEARAETETVGEILFTARLAANHSMLKYLFFVSEELAAASRRVAGPSLNGRRWYTPRARTPAVLSSRLPSIQPNEWNCFHDHFFDNVVMGQPPTAPAWYAASLEFARHLGAESEPEAAVDSWFEDPYAYRPDATRQPLERTPSARSTSSPHVPDTRRSPTSMAPDHVER